MWTFEQSTGRFKNDSGDIISIGYAGKGAGKNNPAMQCVKDTGPLPVGNYTISAPTDDKVVGLFALRLIPDPKNDMCGRSDFFIHGENPAHIGQSSDGCIILPIYIRKLIWRSGDKLLAVVTGLSPLQTYPDTQV